MGLIDRVKNFFEEKEEKPSDISLEKAKELLENNLKENEKVVLSEASSKITSIKHLLNEINLDIQGIEKRDLMEEGDNKYLRKIVSTAQKNMVMQMSGLVQKLGPNTIIDAAGMKNYAKESTETMQKEILSFRKNITYTGVIMKDEMKNIGLMLQKLMKKYGEINELFDKSNIKKFMVIKDKLNELDKTEDTEKKKGS